eukprot:TRINITY_DN22703_c0_g1_i2.p1 TRINITY_DN22703_c0_g1~~TRINITY_DN22703_c0_g1_i2.p1  ORF type:complete len:409 (-),score=27.55 TRINITY_DN22703_c0_g1_i2:568-1794(-)
MFNEEIEDLPSPDTPRYQLNRRENKFKQAFNSYRTWVRENQSLIFSAESLLQQLTWLAPNRFSESELQIETLHTILGLLSWWHGVLVTDHADKAHFCPLILGAVKQIEGLIELVAINRCENGLCRSKFPILTKLEIVKFALRVFTLVWLKYSAAKIPDSSLEDYGIQSSRVIVDDGLPKDTNTSQLSWFSGYQTRGHSAAVAFENFYKTTKYNPSNHYNPNIYSSQYKRLIGITNLIDKFAKSFQEPIKTPKQIDYQLIGGYLILLSEMIHLSRPVAYLLLIRHYGIRSWKPWIGSLSLDALSRILRACSASCYSKSKLRNNGNYSNVLLQQLRQQIWSLEEVQEFNRRDAQLLLYLLRSPCFDLLTKNFIEMSGRVGGSIPMVGMFVDKVVDILVGIQKYYTYTSAS